jgi:hypothetical protein
MLCLYRSDTLSYGNWGFEVDNGGLEGRFIGGRDWELRGLVPEVRGFAEGAHPQPDRPAPENCCHAVQAHRRQSSLPRNGALLNIQFVFCTFVWFQGNKKKRKRQWNWNCFGFSANKQRAKKFKKKKNC